MHAIVQRLSMNPRSNSRCMRLTANDSVTQMPSWKAPCAPVEVGVSQSFQRLPSFHIQCCPNLGTVLHLSRQRSFFSYIRPTANDSVTQMPLWKVPYAPVRRWRSTIVPTLALLPHPVLSEPWNCVAPFASAFFFDGLVVVFPILPTFPSLGTSPGNVPRESVALSSLTRYRVQLVVIMCLPWLFDIHRGIRYS